MHSPFRHTAPPQTTIAAQDYDLTDDWSLTGAHFGARFGAFFH